MIVAITREHCNVLDADDCGRLHVTADGLDDEQAGASLQRAHLGRAGEAGHVWLSVDALKATARTGTSTANWDDMFDAMIVFARSKGWLDASGEHVAAHIERSTR